MNDEATIEAAPPSPAAGAAADRAELTRRTEQEVFARLRPLVAEVTGVPEDRIRMDSVLMADLGAESLDLLDLSFLIEEHFGVTIESDEFEGQARRRIPDGVYERDGRLTSAALEELKKNLPEVDPARLTEGLRKIELPSVLPVATFVHLIQRKLASGAGQGGGDGRDA